MTDNPTICPHCGVLSQGEDVHTCKSYPRGVPLPMEPDDDDAALTALLAQFEDAVTCPHEDQRTTFTTDARDALHEYVSTAVLEAVKKERDACAQLAEKYYDWYVAEGRPAPAKRMGRVIDEIRNRSLISSESQVTPNG